MTANKISESIRNAVYNETRAYVAEVLKSITWDSVTNQQRIANLCDSAVGFAIESVDGYLQCATKALDPRQALLLIAEQYNLWSPPTNPAGEFLEDPQGEVDTLLEVGNILNAAEVIGPNAPKPPVPAETVYTGEVITITPSPEMLAVLRNIAGGETCTMCGNAITTEDNSVCTECASSLEGACGCPACGHVWMPNEMGDNFDCPKCGHTGLTDEAKAEDEAIMAEQEAGYNQIVREGLRL